jgi:uncharacterized low-complexity protein
MKKLIFSSLLGLALIAFTGCTDSNNAEVAAKCNAGKCQADKAKSAKCGGDKKASAKCSAGGK